MDVGRLSWKMKQFRRALVRMHTPKGIFIRSD